MYLYLTGEEYNLIFVGYSTVKFIQGRLGIGKHNFIYFKDKNIPQYQFV